MQWKIFHTCLWYFPYLCMIFPTPAYGNTRVYGNFQRENEKSLYEYRTFKSMEEKPYFRMRYLRLFFKGKLSLWFSVRNEFPTEFCKISIAIRTILPTSQDDWQNRSRGHSGLVANEKRGRWEESKAENARNKESRSSGQTGICCNFESHCTKCLDRMARKLDFQNFSTYPWPIFHLPWSLISKSQNSNW